MDAPISENTQPPVNPFAAHQDMLRERLKILLATLHPLLYPDVVRALEGEGKLLAQSSESNSSPPAIPAGSWSLLVLLVGESIAPSMDSLYIGSVSIALECFVCAIDLLDDIIDGDQTTTTQILGQARVLNVATALLMLAQRAILSLAQRGVAPQHLLRLLNTLQESAFVTVAGQHWDILAESRLIQDFTRKECIDMAAAKAGPLMSLACRLGALCAGADETLCEQFAEMGKLLGIAHQLDNDSHDLYYLLQGATSSTVTSGKSDLERSKKTLPVVLAAQRENTLEKQILSAHEEKQEHLKALHEGITTTWGICLLYRERARDRLQEIEAQQPVDPLLRLLLGFA